MCLCLFIVAKSLANTSVNCLWPCEACLISCGAGRRRSSLHQFRLSVETVCCHDVDPARTLLPIASPMVTTNNPCCASHYTSVEARLARLGLLPSTPLTALQRDSMNKLQWCVLLLATAIVCTESHRLLSAESQPAGRSLAEVDENAFEHQRILAELEEVHQLRERMLQQGEQSLSQYSMHCGTASSA